jgi:7,8-dihydropterin-6-yl-methyl-4-(beta-D-ribofuranosyl)aminobenzene 5'-phosphate synthase
MCLIDQDECQFDLALSHLNVLCGGGALVASLLGGAKPARAEPLTGAVPKVDRLSVRVVIDSYQVAVAPDAKREGVEVQCFGWGLIDEPPGRTFS